MSNLKKIIIAVAVLLVIVGGYFLLKNYKPAEKENPSAVVDNITIFTTKVENITQIDINTNDFSYSFVKNGEKWAVQGNEEIILDQTKVQALAQDFASLNADEHIEKADNLSDFGLDKPMSKPKITLKDGTTQEFNLGAKTPTGMGYYFKKSNDGQVYTIYSAKGDDFVKPLSNFRDTKLINVTAETLTKLEINNAENHIVVEPKADTDKNSYSAWVMTSPIKKDINDEVFAKEILEKMQQIVISEFVEDAPADYETYGLNKPKCTLIFQGKDNVSQILHLGKESEGFIYAKIDGQKAVYKINVDSVRFKDINPMLLVDTLVYLRNIDDVKSMEISGDGKKYLLEIAKSGETATYKVNGKDADESLFKKAYQAVIGITMQGFVEGDIGTDATYSMLVKFNNGKKDETVKAIPYKDRYFAIDIDGSAQYYVPKEQMTNMIKDLEVFSNQPKEK